MLWFLFCFCGSSDGFQRLRNRKYFIFRFDDHHHNKIVAISVIGSVIRMNGVPPRAARPFLSVSLILLAVLRDAQFLVCSYATKILAPAAPLPVAQVTRT